jgi:predicted esterase
MRPVALAWAFPLLAATRAQGAWGVAYAPTDTATPRPAVVFLHGMWADPEEACGAFVRAAAPFFLVCPRGNAPNGAGHMWSGTAADAARSLDAALTAADRLAPGKLDRAGRGTMIGYSNGAYFAVELAVAQRGRWPGLVLLSMRLDLDPARLRAAGVERVVLAAGDLDDARASMQATADRLVAGGVAARFQSLGPGGHPLPSDIDTRMCEAVAWVRGEASPATCR